MMKPLNISSIVVAATTGFLACVSMQAAEYPQAQVTLRVVDEDAKPVPVAEVGIGFKVGSTTHFGSEELPIRGLSNPVGEFAGSAKADRYLGYTVRKPGYYPTTGTYNFKEAAGGKWQPWNPVVNVELKKILHPIPLYARQARIVMPVIGEPVGYDLVAGDFVGPYGRGRTPDFVFFLKKDWKSLKEFDVGLTLTFSNPGDGIQIVSAPPIYGSELKLPRTAPDSVYEAQFRTSKRRAPGSAIQTEAKEDRSFLFRVRTMVDEKGDVKSAQYGKVQGDLRMDPTNSKTAIVRFTYYLNPTPNDRNLEFDPRRNLFENLPDAEIVEQP
jgi:hypothetical protein